MAPKNKVDLSKLSKEEKLLLYDAIQEKKRRAREAQAVYKPNDGQRPVHVSEAQTRVVFSGNGAGKTAMAANEAIWAARGYCPVTETYSKVPARVIVLLDHPDKVADVWLPELQKWANLKEDQLKKDGKPYITRIIFDNGSEIKFMFHEQGALIFESIELDFMIADEPPPRNVYIALRRGGRKKGRKARFLIIGTPIAASWLRTDIYEPWTKGELSGTECFRFGTIVNEANLADGYIAEFSSVLSEKERRIRLEGEFFDLEGLALAHLFKRDTHTLNQIDWRREWPCVVAIDPHPNKKHVAILLGCDADNQLYVLKEYSSKEPPRQFAASLKDWFDGFNLFDIVCDSLGATPMSGGDGNKSFIEVLQEEGIKVRSTRYEDKKEESWITRIQDALALPLEADNFGNKKPLLRMNANCRGLIGDIETVCWVKHKNLDEYKPVLDTTKKDFLSCLKYALASNLCQTTAKSKMYRRLKGPSSYGIESPEKPMTYYMNKLGTKRS